MMDLHLKGADFKRQMMGDVQDLVQRAVSSISAPIAAQQNSTLASDGHRTLNFTGAGVTVLDDAGNHRANIFIPGGIAATTTQTVVSSTTAKIVNVSPVTDDAFADFPSWTSVGFNDAAWATAAVSTHAGFQQSSIPSGSNTLWDTVSRPNTDGAQKLLCRQKFTIPAGPISSATLAAFFDAWGDLWINGVHYAQAGVVGGGTPGNSWAGVSNITVAPTDLIIGVNVIACQGQDIARTIAHDRSIAFRLDLVSNSTVQTGYVNVQDQKASGTSGGTFTSGSWQTRVLSTVATDLTSIASLASNRITLPAGLYRAQIKCPAMRCGPHQARLQNITDSTTVLPGTSENSQATTNNTTSSVITGTFSLGSPKALAVQHQCGTTEATDGFGVAGGFGTEVYTVAEFWKLS